MATATQYNPNRDMNKELLDLGLSKTVYALVTPETEALRGQIQTADYMDQFRDAWTGKQDAYHEEFFNKWCEWSSPVVDLDRDIFPFYYPTAGASEPLRQIIFNLAAGSSRARIHFFKGEYEGYRAMAEAAGLRCVEHDRNHWGSVSDDMHYDDMFFISQPSAIDGNVWQDFNRFLSHMPDRSVVADITYVGAVPESAIVEKFNLNHDSVNAIVFSLSKPFGAYYDRIGGCFAREEDLALFGNRWFKNLTSIRYGTLLLDNLSVFELPERYRAAQEFAIARTDFDLSPSDVYILAYGGPNAAGGLSDYLARSRHIRVCLTPGMAGEILA